MRVLVLGAGGFIGGHIVAALGRAIGPANVVAGVRRASSFPDGIEQRLVDTLVPASVRAATQDISCIVNSVMGSDRAIVESARVTAQLVHDKAVDRAIHLSSIAVHGLRDAVVRESDGLGPPADGYAAAKIEAERRFAGLAGENGVILRPGLVHGPGSALWTLRIGRLVKAGRLGPMGRAGEGVCNLVDVLDVADAVAAACQISHVDGRAFALVGDRAPSWNSYLMDMAAAIGVSSRPMSPGRLAIERALAYPLTAARGISAKIGLTLPDAVTPGLARLFPVRMQFESSAIGPLLPAWRDYRMSLEDGAAWLASQ